MPVNSGVKIQDNTSFISYLYYRSVGVPDAFEDQRPIPLILVIDRFTTYPFETRHVSRRAGLLDTHG